MIFQHNAVDRYTHYVGLPTGSNQNGVRDTKRWPQETNVYVNLRNEKGSSVKSNALVAARSCSKRVA